MLFLAVVGKDALDLAALKMLLRDTAQDLRSLQSSFAAGLVQFDPSKEKGRRVEAAARSWA